MSNRKQFIDQFYLCFGKNVAKERPEVAFLVLVLFILASQPPNIRVKDKSDDENIQAKHEPIVDQFVIGGLW